MLRGVSLELAASGWTVSVVARRHAALASLRQEAAARTGRPGSVNPIPVDYQDIAALAIGIRAGVMAHGPISLAACYIQSSAPIAPIVIADVLASPASPCRYIHIVGSAAPDEQRIDSNRDELCMMPGILYRRVILGFVIEGGQSRWLTDDEICRGVLRAADDTSTEQVVGVLSPWDRHPPL